MGGQLDGKAALVTGAASGIGRATALAMAREGARVVVADMDAAGGEQTAALIAQTGGQGSFVRVDVSRAGEVEALVAACVALYGRLDCAHNNAGILGRSASTVDCTEENWDQVMAVNLKGVWLCLKYEIAQMLKQGGGAIVNTSSTAGLTGFRNSPAYCASKGGVVLLTQVAALENVQHGIRVNAVCPGQVDTPMVNRRPGFDTGRVVEPIGRPGRPEEIAAAVVWLCSDAASYVTGLAMPVDGGYMAE
jgi:NAD(P)-dependent dehydrogenase (short-subunit alcohol dehydrogenase family)